MMNKDKLYDELMVLRAQDGNSQAMSSLISRWNKKLISFSSKYTKSIETSRDIVQESWMVIIKNIHKLKDATKFPGWAFRIVYNKTMDELKSAVNLKLDESELEIADPEQDDSVQLDIRFEIQKLSVNHRTILNLFYLEGMSIKEISEAMSLSSGTVKSRIFYAREKLKNTLKQRNYEN